MVRCPPRRVAAERVGGRPTSGRVIDEEEISLTRLAADLFQNPTSPCNLVFVFGVKTHSHLTVGTTPTPLSHPQLLFLFLTVWRPAVEGRDHIATSVCYVRLHGGGDNRLLSVFSSPLLESFLSRQRLENESKWCRTHARPLGGTVTRPQINTKPAGKEIKL